MKTVHLFPAESSCAPTEREMIFHHDNATDLMPLRGMAISWHDAKKDAMHRVSTNFFFNFHSFPLHHCMMTKKRRDASRLY